ncbi:MAG: CDP-alcohol phosphatidyltransferase family protein [Myxococcales bacterium]|nr:CDP-alcohol phosphatidyltransferase family protein [Myxococcales bacterium]
MTASSEPESTRRIRYLAPNAITAASMMFGMVSLWSAHRGDFSLAAWMIIYAVLTDRLDGVVARLLKATSDLGVQLDSFADFLNFGVAPAFLMFSYVSQRVDLPYHDAGWPRVFLMVACGGWVLSAVFRLARYNITSDDNIPTTIFFGIPTTLAGGLMAIWFLVFLKYEPSYATFGGPKILGDFVTPVWIWRYFPAVLAVGAYLMASTLPMPKVAMTKNRLVTTFLLVNLLIGYVAGFAMTMPDFTAWMPTAWIIIFLVWGQLFPSARALKPPPLFPKHDGPLKVRPQEDLGAADELAENEKIVT